MDISKIGKKNKLTCYAGIFSSWIFCCVFVLEAYSFSKNGSISFGYQVIMIPLLLAAINAGSVFQFFDDRLVSISSDGRNSFWKIFWLSFFYGIVSFVLTACFIFVVWIFLSIMHSEFLLKSIVSCSVGWILSVVFQILAIRQVVNKLSPKPVPSSQSSQSLKTPPKSDADATSSPDTTQK